VFVTPKVAEKLRGGKGLRVAGNPAGNLPDWPGAASVYSNLRKGLDNMARKETKGLYLGRGRYSPSTEHRQIISDMNKGDEETLKYWVHWLRTYKYL
jgi:hypothetical protein